MQIIKKINEYFVDDEIASYLVHEYSEVYLDKCKIKCFVDKYKNKMDEVLEMRVFNEKKELFIYKYNDEYKSIITEHKKGEYFEKTLKLDKKFYNKFKAIKVRKYLDYEDDLAYISRTCLLDFCGGETNE